MKCKQNNINYKIYILFYKIYILLNVLNITKCTICNIYYIQNKIYDILYII